MREIKCRAWDKDAEYMLYSDKPEDDYFFEFVDGKLRAFGITLGPASIDNPPQPETYELSDPMMFAGLHDRQDKEIYEGDIVEYTRNDNSTRHGEKSNHEVYFDAGCFVKKVKTSEHPYFGGEILAFYNFNCEIIGNIYENPELLK